MLCLGSSPVCQVATRRDSCREVRPERILRVGGWPYVSEPYIRFASIFAYWRFYNKNVRHVCPCDLVVLCAYLGSDLWWYINVVGLDFREDS